MRCATLGHPADDHSSRNAAKAARSAYGARVLGRLQDTRGEPRLRVRIMAALIVVGLLLFTAPIVMIPLVAWLAHQL
jgi:hypothetical protein